MSSTEIIQTHLIQDVKSEDFLTINKEKTQNLKIFYKTSGEVAQELITPNLTKKQLLKFVDRVTNKVVKYFKTNKESNVFVM
jgi:hypothetical protein